MWLNITHVDIDIQHTKLNLVFTCITDDGILELVDERLMVVYSISVQVKQGLWHVVPIVCGCIVKHSVSVFSQIFCIHFFGRCIATNLLTKKSRYSPEGHLEVLPKSPFRRSPEFISVTSAMIEARSGDNVTLDCAATGSPIPELTWTFLPRISSSKPRPLTNISQSGLSVVTLHQVTSHHTGTYTCTASVALDKHTVTVTQVSILYVDLWAEKGMRLCLIGTTLLWAARLLVK
jgi:hypothetical protein